MEGNLRLPLHEWIIVILLIVSLLLLALLTLVRDNQIPPLDQYVDISNELVEVNVMGAVEKPGTYEFNKGRKLKDLFNHCRPLPDAELKGFKPNSYLRDGQMIKVPRKEMLTIYIRGAVIQELTLKVEKGTSVKELIEYIPFQPLADVSKLEKKRRLKDQEVLFIELRKEKSLS